MKPLFTLLRNTLLLLTLTACAQATPAATPTAPPATATAQPTATPTAEPTAAPTVEPLDEERTLIVAELTRTYLLHVPSGLESGSAVPLVFAFHGFSEGADLIRNYSDLNTVADAHGFLVVYPNGVGRGWNAVLCCGQAVENNVNDFAFVRQLIADVETLVPVDPKRVYATGFSNGALLTYRLGCEMSETFAAIAPVAGALIIDPCQPVESVSLFHMHGLLDRAVPYAGGQGPFNPGLVFPSIEADIATWAALNGCSESPQVSKEEDLTHTVYSGCKPGLAVELMTSDVLTHSWPSKYVMVPTLSAIIWEFFAAHPKP